MAGRISKGARREVLSAVVGRYRSAVRADTAMVAFGSRHSRNLHHGLQTSRNPDRS
jgi:hypothetical protein